MNDQALTTRGDAISVAYDAATDALARLGVDVERPDLIKSVTVNNRCVTVVRYRMDENGHHVMSGQGVATDTTVISIKRRDEAGESA